MRPSTHSLRLALLLALLACTAPASAAPSPSGPQDDAGASDAAAPVQDETSLFGEPCFVNGKRISDISIKRYLCYGKGSNGLAARKLQILIDQERIYRRMTLAEDLIEEVFPGTLEDELTDEQRAEVERGADEAMQRYVVERADHRYYLDKENNAFMRRYPTLDLDTEIIRAYNTVKWYEDQLWQTLEFDQLFYPDHPDTWPALSIEAIHAGSPNVDLVADYARNYDVRMNEEREEGTPVRREDEMMMALLRDFVMAALDGQVQVESGWDGVPEDILVRVTGNGFAQEIGTEDVYQEMKSAFSPDDIEHAKQFLALTTATHDKLEELGMMKPEADFLAFWKEIHENSRGSMFNMDFTVLSGHQFPSQEAYYEYYWLRTSFQEMIADELVSEVEGQLAPALLEHMPIANGIIGLARARAEILLVSAFDFSRNEWKENGWKWAQEEALELRRQVDTYLDQLDPDSQASLASFEQFWGNMLDVHCEYWDPPMPAEGKMPPAMGFKNKGRFSGEMTTRNDMKRAIGESTFWHYLSGTSIVDTIFFDLEPGTIGGPYAGPHGYYIVRLKARSAPSNPLNWRTERHMNLLQSDYVDARFTAFSHQALIEAQVTGL